MSRGSWQERHVTHARPRPCHGRASCVMTWGNDLDVVHISQVLHWQRTQNNKMYPSLFHQANSKNTEKPYEKQIMTTLHKKLWKRKQLSDNRAMSRTTRATKTLRLKSLNLVGALDTVYLQFVVQFYATSLSNRCIEGIVLIFVIVVIYLNWWSGFWCFLRHAPCLLRY